MGQSVLQSNLPVGNAAQCPALLVAAPASGQGKTTITAALARHYRNRGLKVRCFKSGPDFIDPMILQQASGEPVYQLDNWMVGERDSQQLLHGASREADLILVEGVMGLFDGNPSSADLAKRFNLPVAVVIDAKAMAQTFGALAYGLANYDPEVNFAGVIANRVGSAIHLDMLQEGLKGVPLIGTLFRDDEVALPSRHLGLVQATEIKDLDTRLEQAAAVIAEALGDWMPPTVHFDEPSVEPVEQALQGCRIGIAHDAAFSFVYRANLDLLRQLGATLVEFSPLEDSVLPTVDSLYLPGGYPELYLAQLEANRSMRKSIVAHHEAGKPIVAECGGMLYLLDGLTDTQGQRAEMCALLPGEGVMQSGLSGLGLHTAPLAEGELRGHAFHHSQIDMTVEPQLFSVNRRAKGRSEAIYRHKGITASYLHCYFPSNIAATTQLFLNRA